MVVCVCKRKGRTFVDVVGFVQLMVRKTPCAVLENACREYRENQDQLSDLMS